MEFNFVKPEEARDFVFQHLEDLLKEYQRGEVTFMDVFFRVKSEPVLTDQEKDAILRSPTIPTLRKLWLGAEPKFMLDGVDVSNAVVVVKNFIVLSNLVRMYPYLQAVHRPVPLGVITAYKAVSSIVKGFPEGLDIMIYQPILWREDVLSVLLLLARIAGIKVLSTTVLILRPELEAVQGVSARMMSFGEVLAVPVVISERFEAAVKRAILKYGKAEVARQIYGVDVDKLHDREDWWNYGVKTTFDEERFKRALEFGYPKWAARRIASWSVSGVNDVVELFRQLDTLMPGFKHEEFLSKEFNLRPEVLRSLVNLL